MKNNPNFVNGADYLPPKKEFTVKTGIRVQKENLAEWKMVLNEETYTALEEYATSTNKDAKNGHQIRRGNSLTEFVLNHANELRHQFLRKELAERVENPS